MKRRSSAALVASVLCVALIGCSPAGSPAPGSTPTDGPAEPAGPTGPLTVLSSVQPGTETKELLDEIVRQFEADLGVKVEVTHGEGVIADVFETSAAGGKEADIVMANLVEKSKTWVDQGIVLPASEFIDEWGLRDKINPDALDAWTNADGVIQGLPYAGFIWPVWYNMELLGKANVSQAPTTIPELLEAVRALKAADVPTMVVGGNDWSGDKLFSQIIQLHMTDDEVRQVFGNGGYCASPSAMKGIELFAELRDAGLFVKDVEGYTADQMNATFFEGKAAIMSAGSWAFAPSPEELREHVFLGGFPIPEGGAASKPTAFDGYTGTGFWVSKNGAADDKIDLVRQFISRWYAPEVASAFSATTNGPTAVIIDGPGVDIENSLTHQAVFDLPARVEFALMPDSVIPGTLADSRIREVALAFSPGVSPEQICASLDGIHR